MDAIYAIIRRVDERIIHSDFGIKYIDTYRINHCGVRNNQERFNPQRGNVLRIQVLRANRDEKHDIKRTESDPVIIHKPGNRYSLTFETVQISTAIRFPPFKQYAI
jgi:hypothetical protein